MATTDRELAELTHHKAPHKLDMFKGVKKLPLEEYFTSGHRTCQGCESALGAAAALKALMRKGKFKDEPINVIAFCGDGGGADMGISGISATLTHPDYNCFILMYDNESYANTDIQLSGSTPYGAHTTFSPPGKVKRIMHHRWKKNMAGMLAAGHPTCKFVATVCMSYPVHAMNAVRKGLSIGGPTFIHSLDPCPKGWDYDPMLSHELGE